MSKPVYSFDPDAEPDSAFLPGHLAHLVVGNRGRLLDARRTPISVVEVAPERGSFVVRVEAFEDAGAHWELSLEEVARFQFAREAAGATDRELDALERSRARFDRELIIECDDAVRRESLRALADRRTQARVWLDGKAGGLEVNVDTQIESREGHADLYGLLEGFIAERRLTKLERDFTDAFVTNPRAGEAVKGHAIVLAELGLVPYRGQAPRDSQLFAADWSRARRSDHLLWRLAFTQEVWNRFGGRDRAVYRAAASDGPLLNSRSSAFVSATLSQEVAESHFDGGPTTRFATLARRPVPIDRLLMTFLETDAMNRRFHEAEAVLIGDPVADAF